VSWRVRLSLRLLTRDWRAAEPRVIFLALLVAVAAVTAVSFFVDRIDRAMDRRASELLGADLVLESSDPIRDELRRVVEGAGVTTARTVSFPSVVVRDATTQLVQVKAVTEDYPLRGHLRTAPELFGPERSAGGVPDAGRAWVAARLMTQLGLAAGDVIGVGDRRFEVTRILTYEPGRGGDLFRLAPRVLIAMSDLAATGLLGPASRAERRLLMAGTPAQIDDLRAALEGRLMAGERLRGVEQGRPELQAALDRAARFLGLAALTAVLLGGAATAVGARRFAEIQVGPSAVLRCLGARRREVLQVFLLRLLWLGLLASLAGSALGYLGQLGLAALLAHWFAMDLPGASAVPLAVGAATGMVTLLGFALPPVLRLGAVPPLRVLRRDYGSVAPSAWTVTGLAVAALAALIVWRARDLELAAWALGGSAGLILVLGLAAYGAVRGLRAGRGGHLTGWRSGLARVGRGGVLSAMQLVAFGLGIMALLLLALVRVDLLEAWRSDVPADAPDHFMINIQPGQLDALGQVFSQHGVSPPQFFPMVRARLTAIDGRSVGPDDYEAGRARRLVAREFNLSWTDQLHGDNRIVAGDWWGDRPEPRSQFSVEEGVAETLGIDLGDTLRFRIAGREVEGEVTSLRHVNWDSFNVNFFVLAPPGWLDSFPATYITSFHLDPRQEGLLADAVRRFPSVTVFDVRALIEQVRGIMDRAALAVQYVFGFTLVAALAVLYAAVEATREQRLREAAVMRSLGATRRQLARGLASEFLVLGLIAGVIGAAGAVAVGYGLAVHVFELDYRPGPALWLVGALAGAAAVGLAGLALAPGLTRAPPMRVLRG